VADSDAIKAKGPARPRKVPSPKPADTERPAVSSAEPVASQSSPAELSAPAVAPAIEAVTSPATESDLISAPVETAARANEGLEDMATVAASSATDTANKAEAAFGDFSSRFKTAFEKSSKVGEEMVDFAKGNVEAVIASARVAAQAGETLSQDAAAYGKKHFESATQAFRSFATVKSPTELFQLQSEYAKASFDSAVAEASRLSETFLKVAGEIAQPISNRVAIAAEKFKAGAL
jgi:phasin family protein